MVEFSEDQNWFLAQIKPNGDRLAEENLLRQGFRVFSPKVARTTRRSGRFRKELRALFPGYIFVGVCARIAQWRPISSTLGVQRLVSFGSGGPSRVSNELVALLKERCDETGTVQGAPLKKGDLVRIRSGPFSEFVASIEGVPSERRIWVLLDIMGRGRRMAMRPLDVELRTS